MKDYLLPNNNSDPVSGLQLTSALEPVQLTAPKNPKRPVPIPPLKNNSQTHNSVPNVKKPYAKTTNVSKPCSLDATSAMSLVMRSTRAQIVIMISARDVEIKKMI